MTLTKFALAAALLVLAPLSANAACPQSAAALTKVEAARKAMLALPINDGMETDVPAAGQAAIATMKNALGGFVNATLQCTNADASDAAILKNLSVAAHPPDNNAPDSDNYGFVISFAVSHQQKPAVDLLAVTATFQIECGEDTFLMLFAREGAGWREAARVQSPPYNTVAGGWGTFDYAVSPPDASGKWFVAVKSISPWCSSTWSEIHYGAFRPAADTQKPKQILTGSDSIWFGGDDVGRLKVGVNYVDLRFHAASMDSDVHNREWIRDYRFDGDKPTRIPPFANNAADFADEWVTLDWAGAQGLTSSRPARDLHAAHDAAHKQASFSFSSVRLCKGGDIQVEVAPADDDNGPHTFFLVEGPRAQYFRMKNVSARADPRCTGVNSYKAPG